MTEKGGPKRLSRFRRLTLVSVLLVLSAAAVPGQEVQPRDGMLACSLGVLIGFGFGHFYLGLDGTPFLVGDLTSGAGMLAGGILMMAPLVAVAPPMGGGSGSYSFHSVDPKIGVYIWSAALLVYMVSRIWEAVDIIAAVERERGRGRVTAAPGANPESARSVLESSRAQEASD